MRPVNHCHLSSFTDDHITWIEVSMAYFVMLWHTLKSCKQFISCCRIQILQFVDLPCKLIFQLIQKRISLALYLELEIYKVFHILLKICRIDIHHLFQCLSLFAFDHKCPSSVNLCHLFYLWNIKTSRLYPCGIQRFIKYICLWMFFPKNLYNSLFCFIHFFVCTFYD